MSMRSGIVPLDELRQVILARLATMSLRGVARDVGMSPSGLQKFVDGSIPYLPTRQKLERWYVRESARSGGEMSAEVALAALYLLLNDLPPGRRRPVFRGLVAALETAYDGVDNPRPEWLDDLLREMGEAAGP
ncbi:MAG TPA: hypothetical protein VHG28_17635 [Longimicrobiaceae bacterium]|nr:hypothetical protein [Longimicrobiaceae bacterium]